MEQGGKVTEVANLTEKGLGAPVTALQWYDGAFYFTHRDGKDRTGAVSRMTLDGKITQLFNGFIDSQTDHFLNDIRMGPDGRMYFTSGVGGNCAIMGQDMTPFIEKSPQTHATSAKDIVLTGMNFLTPDFRKTNQLGLSINVTPSITKAVDAQMKKGAGELATLIPMDGKDFEAGYLDAMIKGHTEVLAMIDNQLMKTAKNDMLKAHLTETRGHVAMHLDQAKKLKG